MRRLMTRLFALLTALLVTVGAACAEEAIRGYEKGQGYVYLTMGEYPQTAEGEVQPILWRVLSVEDDRAYLVSEYILLAHRIHPDDKEWIAFGADLRQTEIWAYMNGEFLSGSFTEEEQGYLVDTEDFGRIFLLSREDLNNKALGFGTKASRKAWGTPYALNNGLFKYSHKHGKHSPYWPRSQSTKVAYGGVCTKAEGNLGYIRVVVADEGCRPACYLDLSKARVAGGDGTKEAPFILEGRSEP